MRRRSTVIAARRTAGGAAFERLKRELAAFASADAADALSAGSDAAATAMAVARLRRRHNHTRLFKLEQMIEVRLVQPLRGAVVSAA